MFGFSALAQTVANGKIPNNRSSTSNFFDQSKQSGK